jgi:hypothetical protein
MVKRDESQAADHAVQTLAKTYEVAVEKDWKEDPDKADGWQEGSWSLHELSVLQKAIIDLATAMGGAEAFIKNLGLVMVSQVEMSSRGRAGKRTLKLTTSPISFDTWTVVHELAHVWDANLGWRLSKELQTYTRGYTCVLLPWIQRWLGRCDEEQRLPGCNNAGYFYRGTPPAGSDKNFNHREDFAESVAAYVYPQEARDRVKKYQDHDSYGELLHYSAYVSTKRWAFVDGLVKGTIVP